MTKFYHAPQSRSGRVLWLLKELDINCEIVRVDINRRDGSGCSDSRNPHPESKVPCLVDKDGCLVTETGAILLHLTDLHPECGLGVNIGEPERGAYLTWLFWYGSVMEPVYFLGAIGFGDHPDVQATYRGRIEVERRLIDQLTQSPYLVGNRFTAADLLVCSPYLFFPDSAPQHTAVREWISRCIHRPAYRRSLDED